MTLIKLSVVKADSLGIGQNDGTPLASDNAEEVAFVGEYIGLSVTNEDSGTDFDYLTPDYPIARRVSVLEALDDIIASVNA